MFKSQLCELKLESRVFSGTVSEHPDSDGVGAGGEAGHHWGRGGDAIDSASRARLQDLRRIIFV